MEIKQYNRRSFPVNAVQVELGNYNEVAEWCGGKVVMVPTKMLGVETPLPVIEIEAQGSRRGEKFVATLGCYVVELNNSFRTYKPVHFDASFEEVVTQVQNDDSIYNSGYKMVKPKDDQDGGTADDPFLKVV